MKAQTHRHTEVRRIQIDNPEFLTQNIRYKGVNEWMEAILVLIVYALKLQINAQSGTEVMKLVPCSTQLSTKFILLINVKMPKIVGILTFISMINAK